MGARRSELKKAPIIRKKGPTHGAKGNHKEKILPTWIIFVTNFQGGGGGGGGVGPGDGAHGS